jgi:hypothetical protein
MFSAVFEQTDLAPSSSISFYFPNASFMNIKRWHEYHETKLRYGNFPDYNRLIHNAWPRLIMKQSLFRVSLGFGLATLLAACGAGSVSQAPAATASTAALVQTADGNAQPMVTVATATMPAPDCAAEGCSRPRIIDANAEAYRYDALRRAAAAPQS